MSDMEIKVCLEEANVNKDFFTPNCKENNHKCPVCQNNLHKINIVVSTCTNNKCRLWGSSIPNLVLESLTQAKQDLETAKADIEDYKKYKALWEQIRNNTILELERKLEIATKALKEIQTAQGRCWGATDTEIKNDCKYYAYKALEQIEHKE